MEVSLVVFQDVVIIHFIFSVLTIIVIVIFLPEILMIPQEEKELLLL